MLAAAVAAEATVLCTANTKDFPQSLTASLGVETMTPDALLCFLITEFEPQMLAAHAATVASLARSDRRIDDPRTSPSRGACSSGADGRLAWA